MADDKVQRYDCDYGEDHYRAYGLMRRETDGDYVNYEDYAKLETELQDTKRALQICAERHGTSAIAWMIQVCLGQARKERLRTPVETGERSSYALHGSLRVAVPEPFWIRGWRTLFFWRPACYACRVTYSAREEYQDHFISAHAYESGDIDGN